MGYPYLSLIHQLLFPVSLCHDNSAWQSSGVAKEKEGWWGQRRKETKMFWNVIFALLMINRFLKSWKELYQCVEGVYRSLILLIDLNFVLKIRTTVFLWQNAGQLFYAVWLTPADVRYTPWEIKWELRWLCGDQGGGISRVKLSVLPPIQNGANIHPLVKHLLRDSYILSDILGAGKQQRWKKVRSCSHEAWMVGHGGG